jgi:membrane protein
MIAVGMSVFLSILLLLLLIIVFEVFIHKLTGNQVLNEQIPLIVMGGMVLILMILITTSILLNKA